MLPFHIKILSPHICHLISNNNLRPQSIFNIFSKCLQFVTKFTPHLQTPFPQNSKPAADLQWLPHIFLNVFGSCLTADRMNKGIRCSMVIYSSSLQSIAENIFRRFKTWKIERRAFQGYSAGLSNRPKENLSIFLELRHSY